MVLVDYIGIFFYISQYFWQMTVHVLRISEAHLGKEKLCHISIHFTYMIYIVCKLNVRFTVDSRKTSWVQFLSTQKNIKIKIIDIVHVIVHVI
jgi:hypothetical protein